MKKENIKYILIIILLLILIVCGVIYIYKEVEETNKMDKISSNTELENELLEVIKLELSTSLHRYYDWEYKLDTKPYIVCSNKDKIIVSIRHEDYGDIYFNNYNINGNYYVKNFGDEIVDWQKYCEY